MYVFVYGTLKKDEPNAHWLVGNEQNGKSTYLANGRTVIKYPLVIGSRYNVPFLLDQPGTGKVFKNFRILVSKGPNAFEYLKYFSP